MVSKRIGIPLVPKAVLVIGQSSKSNTASHHGIEVAGIATGPVALLLADPGVFSTGATSPGTTSLGASLPPGELCVGPRRCLACEALAA